MKTHERNNLGIFNKHRPWDPTKVIFNLSSKTLFKWLSTIFASGLDFTHLQIQFFKKLAFSLKSISDGLNISFNSAKSFFQTLAYKYFYNFKHFKIFSLIIKKTWPWSAQYTLTLQNSFKYLLPFKKCFIKLKIRWIIFFMGLLWHF